MSETPAGGSGRPPYRLLALVVFGGFHVSGSPEALRGQRADLLIRDGTVVDGSGGPPRIADVAIRGGRIVAVESSANLPADDTIDARGLHVAPGFIDLHSHADGSYDDTHGLSDPHLADARNLVAQGITTVVVGQDGWHPWPVGADLASGADRWRSHGVGPNVIPLVGYSAARREVLGWSREPPDEEQSRRIAGRISRYLEQGAWGLSTALEFWPYQTAEEVVSALGPVVRRDGVYFSHLRSYSEEGIVTALEEFLATARETGVRAVVSHVKVKLVGQESRGLAPQLVSMLREARREGLRVYADHTPYLTGSIDITLVPPVEDPGGGENEVIPPGAGPPDELLRWALSLAPRLAHAYTLDFLLAQDPERRRRIGERVTRSLVRDDGLRRRRLRGALADPVAAESLLAETARRIAGRGGADRIRVFGHPDPTVVGTTLAEVARARGISPERAAAELTLEKARFVPIELSEEDIAVFVRQPFVAGSSDGWVAEYGASVEQPRSYGAFVRRLERYVVERELIELPEAIRQVTTLPAEILGLEGRGRIAPGYAADLVIFDLERLRDRATFEEPHRFPEGISWVLVNGEPVVVWGEATGARPGEVLLREAPEYPGAKGERSVR